MLDSPGRVVQVSTQHNAGFYTVTADRDGQYTSCFNNHMNDGQMKTVSFYIHEDHRPPKANKSESGSGLHGRVLRA